MKGVVREGQGESSAAGSPHRKNEGWDTLRNPETTIFTVDKTTADRINGYASPENVWLWTALRYNWADCTVPLKSFDYAARAVECAYSSRYGAVPDSDYYIFNVIEELRIILMMPRPNQPSFLRKPSVVRFAEMYPEDTLSLDRYLDRPPTFLSMLISLSLRITIILVLL